MVARADILAGRAVILIDIQDTIEKQLRGIRSKMRMFTNSISDIGGDLFRGGIAGTLASAFPVKEFMTFQDQMLFLQTKIQATDEDIKPLERTIRNLGMTTSFSSQEVAKAGTMFAQAGFSIVETQKALQAALDLARGSQVDLTTSTTILSNAIRTFQVDASMAAVFASKFTTAARLGTLDIVDLGESLKYSAGTFANFGLELDDVLGMITTLANSGLKASLAGTSLNTAFLNLASSAPKLKELLDVELLDADFENPIQALRKLEAGLRKFSKIEQAGILQDLVNIRGGRAIQGLLLQGLDKLEANIAQIKMSTDEARKSAIKLDSALGGVWRRGVSAFQELSIAIGQTSEGPLTKFGENVAAILNDLSRLSVTNQGLVQSLLLIGPASLAAGVGILGLTLVLGKLAMFLTPIMMLNEALFGMAAWVVGANISAVTSSYNELYKLTLRLNAGIRGSFLNSQVNAMELLLPLLQRGRDLFIRMMDAASGSPIRVPGAEFFPFQPGARGTYGTTPFSGKGLGFDPKVFAPTAARNIPDAPTEKLTKALNRVGGLIVRPFRDLPEAASASKQASKNLLTYTKMLVKPVGPQQKFNQLDLPFQFEFDFSESKSLTSFLKTAPATAQFNAEAESIISKIVQKVLGNKVAKRELGRSGNQELELEKRLASAFRKFPVPKELIPRILADVRKQLNAATVKPPEKFVQQLFNFDDAVQEVVASFNQMPLPLTTDLPKQELEFKGYLMRITKESQAAAKTIKTQQTGLSLIPSQRGLGKPRGSGGLIIDAVARSGGALGQAKQLGKGVTPELSRAGKMGASLRNIIIGTVDVMRIMGRFIGTNLVGGLSQVFVASRRVFTTVVGAVRSLGSFITNTNWLRVIITGARSVWTVFRGILSVMNGIRRVVFSLSGWLMIAEFLLLFGDKIPVIKDMLAGLGNAFSNAFGNIGETLRNLGPSIELIGRGFSNMFSGDAAKGLEQIKLAFLDITNTLRTGLYSAWRQFLDDIEPGAKIIRDVFNGLLESVKAVGAAIGAVFGTAMEGGEILIKSDGSLLELFKSAFSTENLQKFFAGVVTAIGSIGQGLISTTEVIIQLLNAIKITFVSLLKSLPGGSAGLEELDENAPARKALRDEYETLRQLYEAEKKNQTSHSLTDYGKQLQDAMGQVQAEIEALTPSYSKITANTQAQREALQKTIDELLANIAAMSSAAGAALTPEAQAAADQAATTANARATTASIMEDTLPGIKGVAGFIGEALGNLKLGDLPSSVMSDASEATLDALSTEDLITKFVTKTESGKKLIEKIGKEIDTNNPLQWLLDSGYFYANEDITELSPEELIKKSKQRQYALGVLGDPDLFKWGGEMGDLEEQELGALFKKVQGMSLEDVQSEASGLWSGFKSAFGVKAQEVVAPQAAQIDRMVGPIGKAIVGDFQSTRGNMLQMVPRMEKLQEEANEHLEEIEGGLATLNGNKNPFVFTA